MLRADLEAAGVDLEGALVVAGADLEGLPVVAGEEGEEVVVGVEAEEVEEEESERCELHHFISCACFSKTQKPVFESRKFWVTYYRVGSVAVLLRQHWRFFITWRLVKRLTFLLIARRGFFGSAD